jgi:Protein of unknown function (DUF1553)/Protein of unknown function (DUF1549)/Planctomycete cytochrome C
MRDTLFLCLMYLLMATPSAMGQNKSAEGLALFRKHVRTDLIHHCLECHGGKSVKADFDLSTHELLMESGHVGDSAADSYLIDVLEHREEPAMPFKKPRLSPQTIARIGKWIDHGAPYDRPLTDASSIPNGPAVVSNDDRDFWSFRPLTKPAPPKPQNVDWCRTDIDRFIMAALEAKGLSANGTTNSRTLRRRGSYGLTGLPPEVTATADDPVEMMNDAVWEHYVDQLLDSPHYGERWARHWMDVARFAESYGYEQDYDRPSAYHYRDFLIKAFNSDMPFDQFVKWQLAGDEFAPSEPLALMATGFLGAGVFPTQLTEAEFESTRYDELDDMTATTGVAFLGLSVGCARCHDHKFDPIPTRDYYRMAATFTKTIRSEIDVDLDPVGNKQRQRDFDDKEAMLLEALKKNESGPLQLAFTEWLQSKPDINTLADWTSLRPQHVESQGTYTIQDDHSLLASGKAPAVDVITVDMEIGNQTIRALRLEALTDDSLPRKGPGRAANGNFALGNLTVTFDDRELSLKSAKATHQQNRDSLSVSASIDDDPISGWAVDSGGIGKDQAAVFVFSEPLRVAAPGILKVVLTFQHPNAQHTMGRFRISVSDLSDPPVVVGGSGPDAEVVNAMRQLVEGSADAADRVTALKWFSTRQPRWVSLNQALADHREAGPGIRLTKVQVNSENVPKLSHHANARGYPHYYEHTHFLDRGDVHQKNAIASPGLLHVLTPADAVIDRWNVARPESATTEFSRARLANWLTDANNTSGQLVARVIVNRVWQHHFGRGIVATPNDFGFQGERPTHPGLLDWLATDLIEHDWKLKRLHRLVLLSSVYRQSSEYHEDRSRIDPDNNFHWRRTPRRLEGEAIRDSMLVVSGQLDKTMFGPGSLDPNMKRRSIYFQIKRSKLIPMMMLFDWPEHLVSIGQRPTTTIAPQALMFMNSPQGRQYAAAFAARVETDAPVRSAFQLAFGRGPTPTELQLADEFLNRQTSVLEKGGDENAADTALVDFCQTLMSMNEFVYVD